jgi:DNA replication and repair protein RecF
MPQDYLATLAQRNAALRRVQLGAAGRDSLDPWTERLAALAATLVAERRATFAALEPGFSARAAELGLAEARLGYDAVAPTADELNARLARDLERGATGVGPHLDDVLIASGDRDLRQFGSQGEQRLAVLSLLLAEAELLPTPPLLLLDDVLSELDLGRREVLAGRVAGMGQTVITATHRSALPAEPAQIVEVESGSAR